MTVARVRDLARLRNAIERLETADGERLPSRVSLGESQADVTLNGGLALGALHEVFAGSKHVAAGTGFVVGLARRLTQGKRSTLWIRQDFSAVEAGDLGLAGFAELGLDPRHIVIVHAANAKMALRIAADALACNALGVVVTEIWGETKAFDLVASRKLTLAAATSGVTSLMLRLGATPQASTAETRWIVRAAHSPPTHDWQAWGRPVFETELVRNRHGATGRWIMEWISDEYLFREQTAHPQCIAAAPVDRPLPPRATQRRQFRAG